MNVREGFMKLAIFCGSAGAVMAGFSDVSLARNNVNVAVYLLLGMALICAVAAAIAAFRAPNQ